MTTLSPTSKIHIEVIKRTMAAFSALGIDPLERAVIIAFMSDSGPWPASALASFIGYPRQTLSRRLKRHQKDGLGKHVKGGWVSTEFGRNGAIMMMNEISAVVYGTQTHLSDELIALCASINPAARPDEARLLSFCHIEN